MFDDQNRFEIDFTLRQLEILLKLINHRTEIETRSYTFSELSRATGIEYKNTLFSLKPWLLDNGILVHDDDHKNKYICKYVRYKIDFDMVAYLVFNHLATRVLYDYAFYYIDRPGDPRKK